MSKSSNPPQESREPTFEETLARLEQVVRDLEDGQLGLAESLARYEDGIRCLKDCYRALDHAERRIEILSGVDADGQPIVEALDEEALTLEEKAEARSRRRSRSSRSTTAETPAEGRSPTPDDADAAGESDRGRQLF